MWDGGSDISDISKLYKYQAFVKSISTSTDIKKKQVRLAMSTLLKFIRFKKTMDKSDRDKSSDSSSSLIISNSTRPPKYQTHLKPKSPTFIPAKVSYRAII
jgi:hypothetical protein